MLILGIDLGYFNRQSAWCLLDSVTGEIDSGTVTTAEDDLKDLYQRLSPDVIGVEACQMAGLALDAATDLGLDCRVANVNTQYWCRRKVKRKTDPDDAEKLCSLLASGRFPAIYLPGKDIRQWRELIVHRHGLVKLRTRCKNQIRCILGRHAPEVDLPGHAAWTQDQISRLETMAADKVDNRLEAMWRLMLRHHLEHLKLILAQIAQTEQTLDEFAASMPDIKRLQTIPGVGPRLAEIVVAFIVSARRFENGKHVASYAGLVPRLYQSGSVLQLGRITKTGNKLLRSMLVEVSWVCVRYNDWARETYHRLRRDTSSRSRIAIVGVARRLLVRCWALMRDGTTWQADAA